MDLTAFLSIKGLSIMGVSIMTLSITTLSIVGLGKMSFGNSTLILDCHTMYNDTQHKGIQCKKHSA